MRRFALPPFPQSDPPPSSHSYDGLLDITHGCTDVTVTYTYLHDHWKASLIGHSDNNGAEDVAITVTLALNLWEDLNSRTPSFRFGHGHIFNNVYDDNNDGINTRDGAQLLVENNVWTGTNKKPLYSTDEGYAVARGNGASAGLCAPARSLTATVRDVARAQISVMARTQRPRATSPPPRTVTTSSTPTMFSAPSKPTPDSCSPSRRSKQLVVFSVDVPSCGSIRRTAFVVDDFVHGYH